MLAEKWKQINDTTWEFKLRHDVTFHDGTPFNAAAIKKTFDRLLDPLVASPRAVVFDMVKEVKPVDEYPYHSEGTFFPAAFHLGESRRRNHQSKND